MKPALTAIFMTFLWMSGAGAVQAETAEVRMLFRNWTTRDGLPHNRVRTVTRSHDGFLWLATDAGVARFDGAASKVFGLRDGLPAPTVLALHEATDHSLWCGTLGGGLGVLKDGRIVHTYSTADGLPSNWIYSIDQGTDGNIVVVTRNGAARFGDGKFQPIPRGEAEREPQSGILSGAGGVKWGSLNGRLMRKAPGAAWQPDPTGPPTVDAVWRDESGAIWACGRGRLWKHSASAWESWAIPFESMKTTVTGVATRDGTVWIAFRRRGLIGFRDGQFFRPAPVLRFDPDMVETVAAVDGDRVWLTTMNGLYQMTRPTIESFAINDPAGIHASNDIGCLTEDAPGELVIATQGSGYFRWKNGEATRILSDPRGHDSIVGNAVLKDRQGLVVSPKSPVRKLQNHIVRARSCFQSEEFP